jgi:hypothetical protein
VVCQCGSSSIGAGPGSCAGPRSGEGLGASRRPRWLTRASNVGTQSPPLLISGRRAARAMFPVRKGLTLNRRGNAPRAGPNFSAC